MTSRVLHRLQGLGRKMKWPLLVLLVLGIGFRMALPHVLKAYVNRQLDKIEDYDGRIEDVDVELWRGAYCIQGVSIVKTTGNVPTPFFAADSLQLSMEWKELWHGAFVGELVLEHPALNFVAGPTPEQSQNGEGKDWRKTLESLFPFKFNRCEVRHGQVHFHNFQSVPPVDIFLREVSSVATNLSNARELTQNLPAGITAQGYALEGGRVALQLRLDPLAAAPTFELDAQITQMDLRQLNDFLRVYGKFDVERGTFAMFTSVAAKEGHYEGYIKVFFDDLDVFAWKKERQKNILAIFWQAIVGTTATVFKNHPNDQLATKIPVSGTFEKSDVGVWRAITTLLRNAFIRALVPKLDEKVTLEWVEEEVKPAPKKKKP